MIYYSYIDTPSGELEISVDDIGLISVLFVNTNKRTLIKKETHSHPLLLETEKQLNAYFNNTLITFDLPLSLNGTVFQKRVWAQLITIPFGKTISYLELAKLLGDESQVGKGISA